MYWDSLDLYLQYFVCFPLAAMTDSIRRGILYTKVEHSSLVIFDQVSCTWLHWWFIDVALMVYLFNFLFVMLFFDNIGFFTFFMPFKPNFRSVLFIVLYDTSKSCSLWREAAVLCSPVIILRTIRDLVWWDNFGRRPPFE